MISVSVFVACDESARISCRCVDVRVGAPALRVAISLMVGSMLGGSMLASGVMTGSRRIFASEPSAFRHSFGCSVAAVLIISSRSICLCRLPNPGYKTKNEA